MPGRDQEPSIQLASGTTNERDGSYNLLNTLGSIFYNTDTSNVEVYHEDPSNNLGWRDLVMNNKEQIDISGNFDISGNVDIRNNLSVRSDNFNQSQILLLAGAGGLNGTGGSQGTARSTTQHNANYVPSNAFNGSLNAVWHNIAADAGDPFGTENLDFEFPYAVHITKYKIWPRLGFNASNNPNNAQGPSAWTLQGSNDGANYVDIEQPRTAPGASATSISTSITDGTGNNQYIVANATNAYKHIRLKITASQNGDNNLSIGQLAYYGYIDGTITANHLTVADGVGIGTTDPSEQLELKKIYSTDTLYTTSNLLFSATSPQNANWKIGSIGGYIKAGTNNDLNNFPGGLIFKTKAPGSAGSALTERMVINANGNVGINNTNPQEKLAVGGNIKVTGLIDMNSPWGLSVGTGKTFLANPNIKIGSVAMSREFGANQNFEQLLSYTKIGNLLNINGYFIINATSTSGTSSIPLAHVGLPLATTSGVYIITNEKNSNTLGFTSVYVDTAANKLMFTWIAPSIGIQYMFIRMLIGCSFRSAYA